MGHQLCAKAPSARDTVMDTQNLLAKKDFKDSIINSPIHSKL